MNNFRHQDHNYSSFCLHTYTLDCDAVMENKCVI